ncbi:MAG: PQQ-dependent sugar dehydrogenase [Candidatus Latescibacteria bacterium]|nr:PQQ-dependent sugar dehydrogenase [Candidatus Latescibacterota bacterium]
MRIHSKPSPLLVILLGVLILPPAVAEAQIGVELVIGDLDQPVRLVSPPDDDRLFVVEQDGLIKVFSRTGDPLGVFLDATALTGASGERGLLGLAFAPDYGQSGRFYINYTNNGGNTRIVRYEVSADPDAADPASAEIILAVTQPSDNHNGGHLEFGPDGMLYIGLGDGGGGGDPEERAQDPLTLLGKMLRLDVSTPTGYAVPPDNPFVGSAPLDEIWHFGLRNPWTFAFDTGTGDLYIADVGETRVEEVNVQPAGLGGLNWGWDITEGSLCHEPASGCDFTGLTLPIFEYRHSGPAPSGCSISGGQVYRGAGNPGLNGHFFFADFCSDLIWSVVWDGGDGVSAAQNWSATLQPDGGWGNLASIGRDAAGELYAVDRSRGEIYHLRLDASTAAGEPAAPIALLAGNTPNPFNPRTTIAYRAVRDGARVTLGIFDLAGHRVRTLVDEVQAAGDRTVVWDGNDDNGLAAPAGVYLYTLQQDGTRQSRRMTLVR